MLERVVDTTGIQCGDFHIHTWRSNDSGDDSVDKVRAGGRRRRRAAGAHAITSGSPTSRRDRDSSASRRSRRAFGSIELTSFEIWGHMGVFPLTPDPTQANAGAPKWQTFPTADEPDTRVRDAVAAGRVRRGARAARGAGRDHQSPARRRRTTSATSATTRRPGSPSSESRLGHEVHARRGVQRLGLAEQPQRQRRRLARPAARGPQGVRGRLVGLAQPRRARRSAIRARASRSAPTIRASSRANARARSARGRPHDGHRAASTSPRSSAPPAPATPSPARARR